jgi:hypothetical protein
VRLRVAGLTLELRAGRASAALDSTQGGRAFQAARGADIRLHLVHGAPPEPAAGALLFDSGSTWRVHRHGSRLLYEFHSDVVDPPLYKAVIVDRRLRSGTLYLAPPTRPRRPLHALDYPLDELLFQHRLVRERALEVHACGLIAEGSVALFVGQSGAGKSTTARLWKRFRPGTPVLSDDRIVLRPRGRGVEAWGTPWHGEERFSLPRRGRLGAVFFLRQAGEVALQRLGEAESAARLLARGFPPPWDAEAMGRALATCARVAARVPCYELAFRADRSAVETVRTLLAARGGRRAARGVSDPAPAAHRRRRRARRP